jgi:hypothetical protein
LDDLDPLSHAPRAASAPADANSGALMDLSNDSVPGVADALSDDSRDGGDAGGCGVVLASLRTAPVAASGPVVRLETCTYNTGYCTQRVYVCLTCSGRDLSVRPSPSRCRCTA